MGYVSFLEGTFFHHFFPSSSFLGKVGGFRGEISHLPNRRRLQNFAWKRCGAPETPEGFKKQAVLVGELVDELGKQLWHMGVVWLRKTGCLTAQNFLFLLAERIQQKAARMLSNPLGDSKKGRS